MSEKGESSRKISSRGLRRERRDSQDTSNMSMKVNVMYRGIVYRVRGIKVLCSVITAVILLLVAIVGLGVWMLVSAYGEEKSELYASAVNGTTSPLPVDFDGRGGGGIEDASTVFSIDFNAPSVTMDELSVAASIPSSHPNDEAHFSEDIYYSDEIFHEEVPFSEEVSYHDEVPFNEAIGHFQGVTPSKDLNPSSRQPGPDPPFGLFSGMIDFGDSKESITTEYATSTGVNNEWVSVGSELPLDSVVELSEHHPIALATPSDYSSHYSDGSLDSYIQNSNGEIYTQYEEIPVSEPDIQMPSLPDNIPRDVDPTLVNSDIPFHFPPSVTPVIRRPAARPGRRRNNPRQQRPIFRRIPPGIRRGQQNGNPLTPRAPYYQRPPLHDYSTENIGEHLLHDQIFTQKQGVEVQEKLRTQQPSTVREAQTETYESPVSPENPDQSFLQKYSNGGGGARLPEGLTLPPGFQMPDDVENIKLPGGSDVKNMRLPGSDAQGRRPLTPGRYLEDMMHYYNKHERKTEPPSADDHQYSERVGLSAQGNTTDKKAPVSKGEGDQSLQEQNSDSVFNHFWNVYNSDRRPPAKHDDRGPVPEDYMGWGPNRQSHALPNPNIRGLRPDGQGYPIRIRPDAENPDRILLVDSHNPPHQLQVIRHMSSVSNQHRPPGSNQHRPPGSNQHRPPGSNQHRPSGPNQHSSPAPNQHRSPRPTQHRPSVPIQHRPSGPNQHHSPVPDQHRPFLGPLHDIYQYSQRLASTLLSFPGNLLSQVDDSRAEHMQNEVELLEDYNKVFQQSNITSTDVLPDMFNDEPDRNERLMILDTEKIRSLNPFELSLITWTFLDFWEFLIEKVGTLSKEDLQHLELRLQRLRQQKDHRMAKSLVTFTVERFSKDQSQDQPEVARMLTMAEDAPNNPTTNGSTPEIVQGRMWDPLGIFSSEQRMEFMKYAIKVVFKFGRVYLKKQYALDCMMLLFCKDLNTDSKKQGMDGMAAKVKSVGLKVLTEREDRQMDTMGEVWKSLTAWETLQCEAMFPRCDGPKALEIVNDVALGSGK